MRKPNRQDLVEATVIELFKLILHETSGTPGRLPPLSRIAERLDVGLGTVREALSRLRGVALVSGSNGDVLKIVPGAIAVSADTLALHWRAATGHEVGQVAAAWTALKWLVARDAWLSVIGKDASALRWVVDALCELSMIAHEHAEAGAIAGQEYFALRCAAEVSGRLELIPLANSLVRGISSFAELHPVVVRPNEVRRFAIDLEQCISQSDAARARQLLRDARDRELKRIADQWGRSDAGSNPLLLRGEDQSPPVS